MELKALIKKAMKTSSIFKQKYEYWTTIRKKKPNLEWLMSLLEDALGREYVREQARKYIEKQKKTTNVEDGNGETT